jgi:hypothetical protein
MFDEFQTTHKPEERRPKVDNLYDVFVAIRDDEMEHVKTMVACQQSDAQLSFRSPHSITSETNAETVIIAGETDKTEVASV